jgi:membrane-associated protein
MGYPKRMEILLHPIDFFLHVDQELLDFVTQYTLWTYVILFLVIFCETGILIAALLPGDSLLLASGAVAARVPESLNVHVLFVSLVIATVLGNFLNYCLGKWLGPKLLRSKHSWLFNKKHIKTAHRFYDRWGGKVIIFASFIPILRTFASFIAGIATMKWHEFCIFSLIGALLWIGIFIYGSYFLDSIPAVKHHLSLIILGLIVLVLLSPLIELVRRKMTKGS